MLTLLSQKMKLRGLPYSQESEKVKILKLLNNYNFVQILSKQAFKLVFLLHSGKDKNGKINYFFANSFKMDKFQPCTC